MEKSEHFKVFRWIDFLSFGLSAIIADLILGYFLFNANVDLSATMLMIVVGICFWIPYVGILLGRNKWVRKIDFTTKHGIPVISNGFPVKREDVERITDETIAAWDEACNWNRSAKAVSDLRIVFEDFPIYEKNGSKRKLAGYLANKSAVVGFKLNEPLDKTALAHELGHEIHYDYTGRYDNSECHKFMKNHGLR